VSAIRAVLTYFIETWAAVSARNLPCCVAQPFHILHCCITMCLSKGEDKDNDALTDVVDHDTLQLIDLAAHFVNSICR